MPISSAVPPAFFIGFPIHQVLQSVDAINHNHNDSLGGRMSGISLFPGAKCFALSLFLLSGVKPAYAQIQEDTPIDPANPRVLSSDSDECIEGARSIHEITPQLALNDFDGIGQTVTGLSYSFSQCLGASANRWFVEASAAHVEEDIFRANAGLVGVGLEWRPFRRAAPRLALIPVIRVGREEYRGAGGATIFDAALTLSHAIPLRLQDRRIENTNTTISVAASQFEWAVRAEYISRDRSGILTAPQQDNDSVVFFASVGLDQAIGMSNWRWKGSASYQTLGGNGPIDGIASLRLAFRIVNPAYTSYDWNFAITGQRGDNGFQGLIFSISRRFSY